MRLFIGIDIGDDIRKNIASLISDFSGQDYGIKFVDPESLHITLKFLGEVDESMLPLIEKEMKKACEGVKPFDAELSTVKYFGDSSYIKVIWLDITEGKGEITGMMNRLNEGLSHIRKEEFKPSPHITIGRVKSPVNMGGLLLKINKHKDMKMGSLSVGEVKLKRSILKREGPVYSDVCKVQLHGN